LIAKNQTNKKEGPFNIEDWWFFDNTQLKQVLSELDIKGVMEQYNEMQPTLST
jgi:hypothetical protein